MSYDCYATVKTGDTPESELYEDLGNMTSNVAPMWRLAMPDTDGVLGLHGRLCADCIEPLLAGVAAMSNNPDEYRALDPANGWGDYDGALAYLQTLLAGCERHPRATFRVSA